MAKKPKQRIQPQLEEIQQEMARVRHRDRYRQALRSTVGTVVVVLAVAVLVATLVLPVLRITGTSMQPSFNPGDIVVSYKTDRLIPGDLCTFYFNNKLLLKRIIAVGGDRVEIDEEGRVSVNGLTLEEPYVLSYALGQCDLDFPFQVPAGQYFVMGDNRETSADSRVQAFGCVGEDEMLGKVLLRVWPFTKLTYYGL